MDCHQAFYTALLQGLAEFLPVSVDSHLVLLKALFDWPLPSPAFTVATQVGTLAAVISYFFGTLRSVAAAAWRSLLGKEGEGGADARLAAYLVIGSVPLGLVSLATPDAVTTALRHPLLIATATLVFALVLALAQKLGSERRGEAELDWKDALIVGLCQMLALVPGASRTGLALTGGLLRNLDRRTAAEFSFLLSIPTSLATTLAGTHDLFGSPEHIAWWNLFLGALLAGSIAFFAIDGFLKLLDRIGLLPFVAYRLILAGLLFFVFL